jgi:hypothetical protein
VKVEGQRYIVWRKEAQVEKDRRDRLAIVATLQDTLRHGAVPRLDSSTVRRYLHKTAETNAKPGLAIDASKLAQEARFDGIFVLRISAKVTPLQAVLRYRHLLTCCRSSYSCTTARSRCRRARPFMHRTPPSADTRFAPFLASSC